jgi:hypothetical protein
MRRSSWLVLALVAGLISWGGRTLAQDALKQELETRFKQLTAEIHKGQVGDSGKVAAPDLKFVTFLGKSGTKQEWADDIKTALTPIKTPEITVTLTDLTTKGDEATAFFSTKMTGEGTLADGRTGTIYFDRTERTLWTKTDGGWMLKSVKHVMQESRLNKRLIPFKASAADEETRQGIQQLYNLMSDVYSKKDWDTLNKVIPDDFPATDSQGKPITKKEWIERIKAGATLFTEPVVFINIQAMGRDGETLKVVRLATIIADVKLPGGLTGKLKYENVTRDTYIKKEKGWGGSLAEELHAVATLDGKPLPIGLLTGK